MAKKLNWIKKNIQNFVSETEIFYQALDTNKTDDDCMELKDYEQVASYSWSSKSSPQKPIIYIPGKAKVLKNDVNSFLANKLNQNSSFQSVMDMNRLYLPDYPMEPIFRSISFCSPNFDYSKINFITDRNNLRKLFGLVDNSVGESFIIDLQKIGNFILMIRREQHSRITSNSYGEDFERIATISKDDYNGHRIISSYGLGNHRFLVRFEVDCIDDKIDENSNEVFAESDEVKNISKLVCIKDDIFKQKTLIELTVKGKPGLPKKKWAQMFFSQTNYLVIGFHTDGILKRIEKLNFEEITERIESRKKAHTVLRKLDCLLETIKNLIKKDKLIYRLVYDHQAKKLKIYELNSYRANLPKDLMEKFSI